MAAGVVAGEQMDVVIIQVEPLGAVGAAGVGGAVAVGDAESVQVFVDVVVQQPGVGVGIDVDLGVEAGVGVGGDRVGDGGALSWRTRALAWVMRRGRAGRG